MYTKLHRTEQSKRTLDEPTDRVTYTRRVVDVKKNTLDSRWERSRARTSSLHKSINGNYFSPFAQLCDEYAGKKHVFPQRQIALLPFIREQVTSCSKWTVR